MNNINVRKKYDDLTDPENPVKRFEQGNEIGSFVVSCGSNGPVEPAKDKVLIACLTPASLTDNVYTVTGDPATKVEVINDGAGDMTVTLTDDGVDKSKVLKPDDVWDPDLTSLTEITFSAGAVFRADLLR